MPCELQMALFYTACSFNAQVFFQNDDNCTTYINDKPCEWYDDDVDDTSYKAIKLFAIIDVVNVCQHAAV